MLDAMTRTSRRTGAPTSIYDALKRRKMYAISLRDFRRQFSSLGLSTGNLRRVIREAPLYLLVSIAYATGVDLHHEDPRPYMTKHVGEIVATLVRALARSRS